MCLKISISPGLIFGILRYEIARLSVTCICFGFSVNFTFWIIQRFKRLKATLPGYVCFSTFYLLIYSVLYFMSSLVAHFPWYVIWQILELIEQFTKRKSGFTFLFSYFLSSMVRSHTLSEDYILLPVISGRSKAQLCHQWKFLISE